MLWVVEQNSLGSMECVLMAIQTKIQCKFCQKTIIERVYVIP